MYTSSTILMLAVVTLPTPYINHTYMTCMRSSHGDLTDAGCSLDQAVDCCTKLVHVTSVPECLWELSLLQANVEAWLQQQILELET